MTRAAPAPTSVSPVSRAPASDPLRPGMAASGAYPHVSRLKLAQELGVHVSTVSNYFSGRIRMPLEVASRVAGLIGVGMEELGRELGKRQKARQAAVQEKRGKGKKRKGAGAAR